MDKVKEGFRKSVKICVVGGHFTPALSVLEEIQTMKGLDFFWLGITKSSLFAKRSSFERRNIESKKIKSYFILPGKFSRHWRGGEAIKSLIYFFLIPVGIFRAFLILLKERPTVIIAFGSSLSVQTAVASWILRIPFFLHEQTTIFSLSSRICSPFARKIFISFESSRTLASEKDRKKMIFTGNPINRAILNSQRVDLNEKYNLREGLPIIYITGGNQGAHSLNMQIFNIIFGNSSTVKLSLSKSVQSKNLFKFANTIHQTGGNSKSLNIAESIQKEFPKSYKFFQNAKPEDQATLLRNADLVITRGGANVLSELMYLGTKCVVIPLNKEQSANAEEVERLGLGIVTTKLRLGKIVEILGDVKFSGGKLDKTLDNLRATKEKSETPQMKILNEVLQDINSREKGEKLNQG